MIADRSGAKEDEVTIEVSEVPDLAAKLVKLACEMPASLAFLPSNLETEGDPAKLTVQGQATTIAKVLRQGGIEVSTLMPPGAMPGFIHNKSHDWVAPVIFVSAELMKTSPDLVGAAIDLVRDYLVSLFKGGSAAKAIKAEIVIEKRKGGTYQKIVYDGDIEGLRTLADMARDIHAAD